LPIKEIRSAYLNANNLEHVNNLIKLTSLKTKEPIVEAYYNVANLILIDYKFNPFEKVVKFKKYSKELDSLVEYNYQNIELRLLRYAVQKKAPRFLKYNRQMDLDLNFIMQNKSKESAELQKFITNVLYLLKIEDEI
tara:strand:+ start:107 stop:517 length:411 start_codon:yes stop_codon:yes gene_type:complete